MTTAVKICGITDRTSLDTAVSGGADYVGLVFFAKSPRHLGLAEAQALRDALPRGGQCKAVALVVDAADDALAAVIAAVDPDFLQLHGHETEERVAQIRATFRKPILKAVPVTSAADVEQALRYYAPGQVADILLFDAKPDPSAVLPGGNGLAFDWHALNGLAARIPFALAGGLTPVNVAEAIARTGASIVDVSSGVESAPGVKDPELIRRFLHNAKAVKQAN
jgi:phosphoribosylanthranilate isomerase